MEKAMAPHSSTLAWRIPWTEEPGGLQSMGSLRVRHDWVTLLALSCIGEGNGNPLQSSCLENPRDGGAWWLPSMGSHRVGHDWSDLAAAAAAVITEETMDSLWLKPGLISDIRGKCQHRTNSEPEQEVVLPSPTQVAIAYGSLNLDLTP